ncbi:hypothetical protein AVEN_218041-1 [Araneus ventricosus]|uniref:Uncharacterized protein n=1 Tax=Araneus ventricosus TaxID=182803 RepID=A0A4Y2S9Q9_ARAVE|nr:hypothetical protein AVEN_218041-1 [Araneus ventricosus]
MQFLSSFRELSKSTNDFAQKRYPIPKAGGFVRWLQHSGETSVNDRKVKGSEQRTQYGSYGKLQLRMRLWSVFDHPLLGLSNYDGNKSQTLERRNMGLGYRATLFICFRKAYYREIVLFSSPTLPEGPNFLLFKGPT